MSIYGTIEINNLRLRAYHGVLEQERKVGNEFEISLKMEVEMEMALKNDDLDKTVNYADVIDLVKHEMDIPSQLLENVAWRIATAPRERYTSLRSVTVKVAKLTPPVQALLNSVAVEVTV